MLGNTELVIEYGRYAEQADAAVTVQAGETIVMATVVTSKSERDGIDYFPPDGGVLGADVRIW